MPKKFIARTVLIALLLSLCLIAGLIGGIDFPLDVRLIRQLQLIRADAPGVTLAAIAITQAGSAYGTVGGGLSVAAWLAFRGERWLAAVLGATVLGERLVVDGMKLLIDRTRPTFDLHPVVTHSSSFPSGHSGNSMAVLLSIALIAVNRAHRVPAVIVAVFASLLIGSTRPYLGVHWPSDVIGGWSLGAAIAILAWTIAESRSSAAAQQQH
jgi:membrane-associated phospholipid phosphatase